MKKCSKCNTEKPDSEFYRKSSPWCIDCQIEYSKTYAKTHREKIKKRRQEYRYRHPNPVEENKDCSSYLGCYINERILRHVMPNAVLMDTNNPGYDLVCGKGYLVDAKASSTRYQKNRSPRWTFCIKKNKTPDYFLLTAYKDRESLEICGMWLVPGDLINDKVSLTISLSNIHKWDAYKIDHMDALSCVSKMTAST